MSDRNSRDSRDDRGSRDRDSGRDSDRGGRDRGSRDEERGGRDRGSDRGGRGSSGSSSRYTYQPRSREDVEKRQHQGANDYDRIIKDGIKQYSPAKGPNRIRILPPTWANPKHYGFEIFVHYQVGADGAAYLDLDKMTDKPDPITEEIAQLRRDGEDDKVLKAMDSKKRVGVFLVDRDEEEEGVQFWAMPWTIDKDISLRTIDKSDGSVLQIDDPENGYDIEFVKEGEKKNTKYLAVEVARRPSRLGKTEWLDFAVDNPIPDVLKYYSYDEIAKVFGGGGAHRETRDNGRDDRGGDRERDAGSRDRDRGNDRGRDDHDAPRDEGRGSRHDYTGGRDRDDRDSRGGGTEDAGHRRADAGRGRSEGRSDEPELTWDSVHAMTGDELDAIVAARDELSKINPNEAKTDAELADWICEDLKIEKRAETRSRRSEPEKPAENTEDRLANMRRQRDGGDSRERR